MEKLLAKVLNGEEISKQEALNLFKKDLISLIRASNILKKHFKKGNLHFCCAVGLKIGNCSQNCGFCAQSGFYETNIFKKEFLEKDLFLKFLKVNSNENISSIGLNTSTGYYCETNKEYLKKMYSYVLKTSNLKICAAHGILKNQEEAQELKRMGVFKYEHNLQTSANFFKNICTTHKFSEKISTIKYAKKAGLLCCSGGILGMGETKEDLVDLAFTLKELGISSIPLNILTPVKKTPLGELGVKISQEDVLKTIAVFRFILPSSNLILGAGRSFLKEKLRLAFFAGLNGMVVGNLLTFKGDEVLKDIEMVRGFS